MSRVRFAKPPKSKRPPRRSRAVLDHTPVLLQQIEAGAFAAAEVEAIERLMHDEIDKILARSKARQKATLHPTALPVRPHRDSNR